MAAIDTVASLQSHPTPTTKRQRPSLDTSFASLSLDRSSQQRSRADSAASRSSSSAFATPPEGHSPRHSLHIGPSGTASTITDDTRDNSSSGAALAPRIHSRNASVGSAPLYEFVKAKYDYIPDHPSGLPFYAGQLIQVHYKDQSGWWDGEVSNIRGWFPSNYLFKNSSRFIRAPIQVSSLPFLFSLSNAVTLRSVMNLVRYTKRFATSARRFDRDAATQLSGPGIPFGNLPSVPYLPI